MMQWRDMSYYDAVRDDMSYYDAVSDMSYYDAVRDMSYYDAVRDDMSYYDAVCDDMSYYDAVRDDMSYYDAVCDDMSYYDAVRDDMSYYDAVSDMSYYDAVRDMSYYDAVRDDMSYYDAVRDMSYYDAVRDMSCYDAVRDMSCYDAVRDDMSYYDAVCDDMSCYDMQYVMMSYYDAVRDDMSYYDAVSDDVILWQQYVYLLLSSEVYDAVRDRHSAIYSWLQYAIELSVMLMMQFRDFICFILWCSTWMNTVPYYSEPASMRNLICTICIMISVMRWCHTMMQYVIHMSYYDLQLTWWCPYFWCSNSACWYHKFNRNVYLLWCLQIVSDALFSHSNNLLNSFCIEHLKFFLMRKLILVIYTFALSFVNEEGHSLPILFRHLQAKEIWGIYIFVIIISSPHVPFIFRER